MVVLVLVVICLNSWPILQILLDRQASSAPWIIATSGSLNLYIPIWIFASYFLNYGESPLKKFKLPTIIYSCFAVISTGLCAVCLLHTIMVTKASQYTFSPWYLIILTAVQLFLSLGTLFIVLLLHWDSQIDAARSERRASMCFLLFVYLIIIGCAISIVWTIINGTPVSLELAISLLGLIGFGVIFLIFVWPCLKPGVSSDKTNTICSILYFLLYFPFFSYWTVRSLIAVHQNIDSLGEIRILPLCIAYFATICSMAPGMIGMILLGLMLGFGILYVIVYGIMAICSSIARKCCPQAFPPNPYDLIQDNDLTLNDPLILPGPYLPSQVQPTINLQDEEFNPGKHRQSFLEEEVCSVCLEGFEAEQIVTYWPKCEHLFHKECLSYWIKKNPTCPNCKKPYISNP